MAKDENRQALMRIAAVLLSLGDLAERAATRSWPVLCLVLCILRPAEAIARHFVVDMSRSEAFPAPVFDHEPAGSGGGRIDALRLAATFRLLADVLGALAAAATMSRSLPQGWRRRAPDHLAEILAGAAPASADTS